MIAKTLQRRANRPKSDSQTQQWSRNVPTRYDFQVQSSPRSSVIKRAAVIRQPPEVVTRVRLTSRSDTGRRGERDTRRICFRRGSSRCSPRERDLP